MNTTAAADPARAAALREKVVRMRAPWSLRVYALFALEPFVVVAATGDLWHTPGLWAALGVVVALVFALLRGSRVAWVVFLALELSVPILTPFDPPPWWSLVMSLGAIACLVAPPSRRFVWRPRRRARAGTGR